MKLNHPTRTCRWVLICGPLVLAALVLFEGCGGEGSTTPGWTFNPETLGISVPEFPDPPFPEDNALTRQGVDLGRRLFYDPILSGDSTQACADCHTQVSAFSDEGRRFSVGIDGIEGDRNAPALINVGWGRLFFWDGRAKSLEIQALEPVHNPIEMHLEWEEALARLQRHPEYPNFFREAFGDEGVTVDRTVKAIAQFERTLVSNNSKYDRYLRRETELSASEKHGEELFFNERGDCFHCHPKGLFTDNDFHDIGLEVDPVDGGLGEVTQNPFDMGKFKTPTLRNIELTTPYMHDGRFRTLDEVLDHYNGNAVGSPNVDPLIRVGTGLGLTDGEKQDIIAFLKTLTDPSFIQNPDFENPHE